MTPTLKKFLKLPVGFKVQTCMFEGYKGEGVLGIIQEDFLKEKLKEAIGRLCL